MGTKQYKRILLVGLLSLLWLGCTPKLPPTLDIAIDATAYEAGATVKLTVTVTNFTLSQDNIGKANQDGTGHYRVYLDNKSGGDFLAEDAKTSTDLILPKDLAPGNHILKVVLLNNDNTTLVPVNIERTITFAINNTAGPSVSINADKTTVGIGDTVTLTINIQNYKLEPISAEPVNKGGTGHYHLAFDDSNPEQTYLTSSIGSSIDLTIPDDVTPGKHTLWVYLMQNNHTKLSPEVKASVELEIVGGTKPSIKATPSAQEFDPGDALSIDIEVKNFKLGDPKINTEKKLGEGHYRIALDDADPSKEFLVKNFKERAEVALPAAITPGPHKLVVHLVNNDGTQLDPPVSASINISIKGGLEPKLTATVDNDSVLAGEKLNVTIKVENFTLSPISNTPVNKANEGHYHIVIDDQDPEKAYVVFGAKETMPVTIPTGTSPGPHKLWVYLMNNDHSLYVPTIRFAVDITVKSGTEPAISVSLDNTEITESGSFELTVETFNFTLQQPVTGAPNDPKAGHYHVTFDDDDPEKDYAMAPFAKTVKATLPSRLKPGKHILWVYLMNNDHTKLKPEVRDSITFTVKAK